MNISKVNICDIYVRIYVNVYAEYKKNTEKEKYRIMHVQTKYLNDSHSNTKNFQAIMHYSLLFNDIKTLVCSLCGKFKSAFQSFNLYMYNEEVVKAHWMRKPLSFFIR